MPIAIILSWTKSFTSAVDASPFACALYLILVMYCISCYHQLYILAIPCSSETTKALEVQEFV